jgi:hypothetical protein
MTLGQRRGEVSTFQWRTPRPLGSSVTVKQWLPSITDAVAMLERGVPVADVGCGYGHSTVLMAEAFPQSRFAGYDSHLPSIAAAQQLAEQERGGRPGHEPVPARPFRRSPGSSMGCRRFCVFRPRFPGGGGPQALGNHAGEGALRDIAAEAGLLHWRLAAEGPVSRVYEVRR